MSDGKQRLFIGVPLPSELLEFVQRVQGMLPAVSGLRLMRPEQLHVTLAFIGMVDEAKGAAARAVLESLPGDLGGEAAIRRFLFLPSSRKARVVALELSDEDDVFGRLFAKIMDGLESSRVMVREARPFRPHLTVARLRTPGSVVPRSESGQARFAVESVCLYESELTREGAVHSPLARAALTQQHCLKT